MLITQIENKGVMTETVNWGIPHKRFAVTTYSDGQVKMIKSPLLLQQGLGNNTADWLNLWNAINDKF